MNNNNSPLLIHIGFPKAGSTWLQRSLFTNEVAGFCSPWGEIPELAIEHLMVADTFELDRRLFMYQDAYQAGMRAASAKGLVPVISYEHFLFDQMRGKSSIRETVRRIKLLYPRGKLLLVIREQISMLLSSYVEHLRKGFTTPLSRFLGAEPHRKLGFGPVCDLDLFLYHNLVDFLYHEVGRENVLILPLELIHQPRFAASIIGFAGANGALPKERNEKAIRKHRKSDLIFLRLLNHMGHSRYNNFVGDSSLRKFSYLTNKLLAPLVPDVVFNRVRVRYRRAIEEFAGNRFEKSNVETSKLIGLDLASLGYAVPQAARILTEHCETSRDADRPMAS